jgi:uncharacterized protein with FMN-binding domain
LDYLFFMVYKDSGVKNIAIPAGQSIPQVSGVPVSNQQQPSQAAVSSSPAKKGHYKDGTYTGSVEDAFYGNIQVRATINSGKITDVQFLQYPSDRGTSVMINKQAMPILFQERRIQVSHFASHCKMH